MSGRSSARSALVVVAVAAACGGKGAPEADPAKVEALAKAMVMASPPFGFLPCADSQVIGGASLTYVSALKLAKLAVDDVPERAEWVNPPEIESPAVHPLLDPAASTTAKRRAAAELLSAPFFIVYRIDLVNAPVALGIKELKIGSVGARAIRYDQTGKVECVRIFNWQNDDAKNKWAIEQSNMPQIDPAVAKAMRDDLRAQMLKRIRTLAVPPALGSQMQRKPPDGF